MITAHQHRPIDVAVPPPPSSPRMSALVDLPEGEVPPIEECGEPLVVVDPVADGLQSLNLYAAEGWPGTAPQSRLRAGVVERLQHAQRRLPEGFSLSIFDAYRSLETQRALFDRFYGPGSTLPPGYVADPDDLEVPPPHTTGGAVDLTLAWEGQPLALGTWFDEFTPLAATDALDHDEATGDSRGDVELDAALRRLLHSVLRFAGFAGLSSEWWHVSYGDQQWAHQYKQPHAIYGPSRQAR